MNQTPNRGTKEQLEKLLKRVTGALYDAVRTDWDQQSNHDAEDDLISEVEETLNILFSDESDENYRQRILEVMPPGHTYWAEDLGNAHGDKIDKIGAQYGVARKRSTE